jgi:hypothetical protein
MRIASARPSASTCSLNTMPLREPASNRATALRSRNGRRRRSSPFNDIRSHAHGKASRRCPCIRSNAATSRQDRQRRARHQS